MIKNVRLDDMQQTQKGETKEYKTTTITLEENDSIEDVIEEIKEFLDGGGIIRGYCSQRPFVFRTVDSIIIRLNWYPPNVFKKTYNLEIESDNQELLNMLYEKASECVNNWFDMTNELSQKK